MHVSVAFAGLRHGHIFSLLNRVKEHPNAEVVAVCDEDAASREEILKAGSAQISHTDISQMLAEVECDVVAIGDYFSKRGSIVIEALEAGKHVISDKPLCTRLDEWQRIESLSRERDLKVGCMFTMRDGAQIITIRNLLQDAEIGEVHAISFGGQHPLMLSSRAAWYFEPGTHGGTINDIGCHAIDAIPWLTGLEFATINAARSWNAFAPDFPHFQDAGQMMLTMDNGCGVLGDVSYFLPDSFGYTNPLYWRMTFWGRKGVIETSATAKHVTLMHDGETKIREIALAESNSGGCLSAFLNDIQGIAQPDALSTPHVLKATRTTLMIQRAADRGETNVAL